MSHEEKARELAAENMDWQQVVLNGGPPCFHLEGVHFCGRAQRWDGHLVTTDGPLDHKFVSVAAALLEAERSAKDELWRYVKEFIERETKQTIPDDGSTFEDWFRAAVKEAEREALERGAQEVDQCNHEGPYNAIGAAERIRALAAKENKETKQYPCDHLTFADALKWLLKQGPITSAGDRAPTGLSIVEAMIEELHVPPLSGEDLEHIAKQHSNDGPRVTEISASGFDWSAIAKDVLAKMGEGR